MNILLMGAAGSGKGTMAARIIADYDIPHISSGNMFRAAINAQTELGKIAQTYMDRGHLVPDELTIAMVKERLSQKDCQKGYLLDGFPRTLKQAEAFEDIAREIGRPVEAVFNLTVHLEDLKQRVTGRRICETCGAIYNTVGSAPKVHGICDRCGSPLVHRSDDTVEQLGNRLHEHMVLTQPVLDFYREKALVHNVDASRKPELVYSDIYSILRLLR
ncbi:MAG: adenylate kinase [Erysipelotrichaceae bacterium]|jgi:adenylate kinase|nr:adenylate kinase [Erysipelotrichaceae bacterium]